MGVMKYSPLPVRAACFGGGSRRVAAAAGTGGEVERIDDAKQAGQAAGMRVKIT